MNAGGGGLQRITDVAVTSTTASGRVGELRIAFEHGDVRVPGSMCGPCCGPGRSAAGERGVSAFRDEGRWSVTRVIAAGAGVGHAWVCASGARWAAPGRAKTTVRFSPLTSRGPMSSASIKAVGRPGGPAIGLIVLFLSVSPSVRLSAQGLLSQFSYDNLKPSALQLDVGPLGGNNIRGAAHRRHAVDYGLIARTCACCSACRTSRPTSARPPARASSSASRVSWSIRRATIPSAGQHHLERRDGDLDLQYLLPQGHARHGLHGHRPRRPFPPRQRRRDQRHFVQDALTRSRPG